MSYLKIIGGAVLGVGAVAAAPFTGGGSIFGAATLISSLAGVGTVATAAGVAAAGAATGRALSCKEKEELHRKLDSERARHELEKKEMIDKMSQVLNDTRQYYEFIVAMHAIGVATANADGEISIEEAKEIEEFVGGVMADNYPDNVKKQIRDLTANPPTLMTAFSFLKRVDMTEKGWNAVNDLIEVVISADDYEDDKEKEFRKSWRILSDTA